MTENRREFSRYCKKYYKQVRKANEKRLSVQRDNYIKECKRLLRMLNKKELYFRKAIKKIKRDIMPYIRRMKFTPNSYKNMMDFWECEYNQKRGML